MGPVPQRESLAPLCITGMSLTLFSPQWYQNQAKKNNLVDIVNSADLDTGRAQMFHDAQDVSCWKTPAPAPRANPFRSRSTPHRPSTSLILQRLPRSSPILSQLCQQLTLQARPVGTSATCSMTMTVDG